MSHNMEDTYPAAKGSAALETEVARAEAEDIPTGESPRQKILIVDDQERNLLALEKLLEPLDVDLVKARNGNEALAATLDTHFALAVLDVVMPGMDGFELAEYLRGDEKTRLIPIIFVTASLAEEQHIFQGYEAGGIDYIVKPIAPEILLGKVRMFLELDRYRNRLHEIVDEQTQRIRHLNAVLRGIRDVNKIIVQEKQRDVLIERACEALVGARGFNGVWIVLTDNLPDSIGAAQTGWQQDVNAQLADLFREGNLPPCCRDAQADDVFITKDRSRTCADCPLAESKRLSPALSARLEHEGLLFGYICVSVPQVFTSETEEEEKALLQEIAGDIAFGLSRIDAEAARDKSDRTLRAIFDSASDGLLLADAETLRFVSVNPAITRMLDYSQDELKEMSVTGIYCAEDLQRVLNTFQQQLHDKIIMLPDTPVKRKDGSVFSADINAAPLDLDGRKHIVCVFRDITNWKKATKELEQSEQKFREFFEHAPEYCYIIAPEGTIIDINRRALQELGYEKEYLVGKPFETLFTPGSKEHIHSLFSNIQSHGEPKDEEAAILCKNGEKRTVLLNASTVYSKEGALLYTIAVQRDVTERRQLERQLEEAQKMESIGRLAGGVAHDFNNMLGVILGYGEDILSQLHPGDPLRESAKEVVEAGRRSAALTRQLLAFSRRQTLRPEVLNLNFVLKNLEKMLHRLIGEDIELSFRLAEDLERVEVDPGQIEQVIMNMAVNARDAMPQGGQLIIETANNRMEEEYPDAHFDLVPGDYVVLSVSDNGCGMDEGTKEKIFEPFFTTKEKEKGTGLGLSTVYGIVKQSGGNIWVYSEPGLGTTFRIYLPKTAEALTESEKTDGDNSVTGNAEQILVVEDEPSLRKLIQSILGKMNYNVETASNGGEALILIEDKKLCPDLVIMDVVMPGMSGNVLADRLRRTIPDLKIVFMSGYSDDAIANRGILDGNTPFIQKPFTKTSLSKEVKKLLST